MMKKLLVTSMVLMASVSSVMANATDPLTETKKTMTAGAVIVVGLLFMAVMGLGIMAIFHSVKGYTEGVQKAKQEQSNPVVSGLNGALSSSAAYWILTFIAAYIADYLTKGQIWTVISTYIGKSLSG